MGQRSTARRRAVLCDLLGLAGLVLVLVSAGCGWAWLPLGLIVPGLALCGLAIVGAARGGDRRGHA
jgi:hypothetical protein